MPLTSEQIQEAIEDARGSLKQGNIPRADLICQSLLVQEIRTVDTVFLLGQIAMAIGEYNAARWLFAQLRSLLPAPCDQALSNLSQLEKKRLEEERLVPPGRQRFHLIKAWGFGFASDLDHTLGHLLLAELTGRTPVIHWGLNSLFRDANAHEAWTQFFEPVSRWKIGDLARSDYSFFPPKWSAQNLICEEINKMQGPGSCTAGILYLNQPAEVTVADFFAGVIELMPWVRPPARTNPTAPVTPAQIEGAYRYLVDKYLKPRPHIIAAVDAFAEEHFRHNPVLAVHVRGSDKIAETSSLPEDQKALFAMVQAEMNASPDLLLFLLTDDATVQSHYAASFPGRVINTDCARTSTGQGVHYQAATSRSRLGFELLRDAYLAARCERFFGLGSTNVSNLIMHLKPWPAGAVRLIGPIMHYGRSLLIA